MPHSSPPRWLERMGETLIPPASAEHALGDLAECSRSSREYLAHLTSIVPRLVWCQIRRRATVGGVVFNAVLSAFALVVAQRVGGGSFLDAPSELVRLQAPWLIWVIGCALAAAYGPPGKPFAWNNRLFAATIVVSLAAGGLLGVPIVRLGLGLGATFGISMLLAMPLAASGPPPPLSLETLPQHARLFQKTIWWRNAREQAVGAVLLFFLFRKLGTATGADFWAQVLFIAGVVFVIAFLFLKASPRRMPRTSDLRVLRAYLHDELVRQRDLLRAVMLWYLFPLVPGFLMSALHQWQSSRPGALGSLFGVAVICALVWLLNKAGAKYLDSQVRAVESLPLPAVE